MSGKSVFYLNSDINAVIYRGQIPLVGMGTSFGLCFMGKDGKPTCTCGYESSEGVVNECVNGHPLSSNHVYIMTENAGVKFMCNNKQCLESYRQKINLKAQEKYTIK